MDHFSIRLWWVNKSWFYTTTSNEELSGWTKKKLQSTRQSQTCTRKKKRHGHCLVVWCWFDLLQLFESQWNHNIWDVCSANRWDALKTTVPEANIGQQKEPKSSPWQCSSACHTATASKVEQIGPHLSRRINLTSCQWTTTSSSILTTFVRQNGSAMSRRQKCFPRVHWIPKHGFLCYRNNTFFIGKTVLIVTVLTLINKHVSLVVMI